MNIEDEIIESKTINPCIDYDGNLEQYILYCFKPENFKQMVKCENNKGDEVYYEVMEEEIKFILNQISPITMYYTVTNSHILNQLKEICGC